MGGYYFGKGAVAPTDQFSASPTSPMEPNNQAECTQKCNDRYQKDLDNPSVDYAAAQQRYNDCKMSCQDIPAIQAQAGSAYERTSLSKRREDEDDDGGGGGGPGGGGGIGTGGGCTGGKLLHEGKMNRGDHDKCGEGFRAKVFQIAGGYLHPDEFETWCCPGGEEEERIVCYNGVCVSSKDVPPEVTKKLHLCVDADGNPCPVGTVCDGITGDCSKGDCTQTGCGDGYECNINTGKCEKIGGTGDDACEGGHILDNRYTGGKGTGLRPLTAEERDPYIPEDAGWMRSSDWQGHQVWNAEFGFQDLLAIHNYYKGGAKDASGLMGKGTRPIDFACEKGMTRKTINGEQWCCPSGDGGTGEETGLGEYQWPAELKELYDLLMGRGKEFMGMEPGYTDEAIQAMFGRNFENIRDVGARTAETGLQSLQREGLMGTGTSQDLASEAAWGTERGISDTMRDLFVADEEKKKQDLMDYTGAAQNIFGGGIGYNSMLEQINAGRRGEGRESMAMLLQYLMSLMSSWGA